MKRHRLPESAACFFTAMCVKSVKNLRTIKDIRVVRVTKDLSDFKGSQAGWHPTA